jgi:hypothetical protein
VTTPKKDESTPPQRPSGRVRHDERGQAVWQWAADTARNAIHSTSALLRKLEVPGLSLQDDPASQPGAPRKPGAPNARATGGGRTSGQQGYNAYIDKRNEPSKPAGARTSPAPAPGAKASPPKIIARSRAPVRSSWWRRLLGRD